MKFSIIVPVYNVEAYLSKCVDSLLSQSFFDFELILINDGSTDNCRAICDNFQSKDNRVNVIHKNNGGLSSARNAGILSAKGEYLIFVDSDDYWDSPKALTKVSDCIHGDIDVLLFGRKELNNVTGEIIESFNNYDATYVDKISNIDAIKYLFKSNLFPGSAWVTVTRKDLIILNKIFFTENIIAEDVDWLIHLFTKVENIRVLNETFYVYLTCRNGSITNTASVKSVEDILFTINKWSLKLDEASAIHKLLLSHLAYEYCIALYNASKLSSNQFISISDGLHQNKHILKYAMRREVKVIAFLIRILSLDLVCKIINQIYRFTHV